MAKIRTVRTTGRYTSRARIDNAERISQPRFAHDPEYFSMDWLKRGSGISYLVEGFNYPDGLIGGNWVGGGNLSVTSMIANINPVEGPELLTDPDFEGTYTAGKVATLTKSGNPTLAQSAVVHAGAKAQQFQATANADFLRHASVTNPPDNTHYVYRSHARRNSGTSGKVSTSIQQTGGFSATERYATMDGNYHGYEFNIRTQGTGSILIYVALELGSSGFDQTVHDDCSLKALVHSSLFKFVRGNTPIVKVGARISIPVHPIRGGVVICADDPNNPQNAYVAWIDRIYLKVDKIVNGAWTNLYSTTVWTYNDFSSMQLGFDGSFLTLVYGGTVIGSPIAVSDPTIINNVYHGIFATSANVSFGAFGICAYNDTLVLPNRNALTVSTNNRYNAFPGIIKTGNKLIGIYNAQDSHQSDAGVIVQRNSFDNGATWGPEITIASEAQVTTQVANITKLANGDLITPVSRWDVPGQKHLNFGTMRSTDNGATWGARIAVTTGFTSYSVCTGTVVELPGGNLLVAYYGRNIGDGFDSVRCSVSSDGGSTWGSEVVIANGQVDSKNYHEPELMILSGSTVLCAIRSSNTGYIAITISANGGAAWGAITNKFFGNSAPHLAKLSSGRIVCAVRSGTVATQIYSSPDGTNWYSTYFPVDHSGYQSMYAAPVDLGGGAIGCLYSVEFKASEAGMFFATIPEWRMAQS